MSGTIPVRTWRAGAAGGPETAMEPADRPLIRWKLNPERVRFALEEAPSLRVRNGIARPS